MVLKLILKDMEKEKLMSSEKQLILIILVGVVMFGYQWIKDEKKKNDYYKKYRKSQGWE
jgi:hypothetical protein